MRNNNINKRKQIFHLIAKGILQNLNATLFCQQNFLFSLYIRKPIFMLYDIIFGKIGLNIQAYIV